MGKDNGRVDYLREDFQALREEMNRGFDNILSKFDELRKNQQTNKEELYDHCSDKRSEIEEQIANNAEAIAVQSKKIYVFSLVGSGVGFILGLLVSEFVPRMFSAAIFIKEMIV